MPSHKMLINPDPKPRMTQSDRWQKRPCVEKYWAFKDELNRLWGEAELPEAIGIVFVMPMPESWSEKRKAMFHGNPHQQKPDIDNLVKSVLDCLAEQDAYIWRVDAAKYWGREGSIEIRNLTE